MKKITFTIISVFLFASGAFGQTTMKEWFAAGTEQLNKKNYDAAIASFSKCISLDSRQWGCYYNRALAYQGKGEIETALKDATAARNLAPDKFQPYVKRADLNIKLKNFDAALPDLNKALELNPNIYEALVNRGIILKNKGKNDEAVADLTRAINLRPTQANAYIGRSMAYCNLGKEDQARRDENAALLRGGKMTSFCESNEMTDDDADLTGALGRAALLESKGEYDAALTEYAAIIKDHPNEFLAFLNRAKLYDQLKKKDLALADVKKALSLKPNDKEASQLELKIMASQVYEYQFKSVQPSWVTAKTIFNEQFDDNKNGWAVGKNANSELVIAGGIYNVETKSAGANIIWVPLGKAPKIEQTKDFRIKAKFKTISGNAQNAIGIVWGLTDGSNMYEAAFRRDGTWFYGKRKDGANPRADERRISPDLANGNNSVNEITLTNNSGSLMIFFNGRLNDSIPLEAFNANSTFGFVLYGANKVEIDYLTIEQK